MNRWYVVFVMCALIAACGEGSGGGSSPAGEDAGQGGAQDAGEDAAAAEDAAAEDDAAAEPDAEEADAAEAPWTPPADWTYTPADWTTPLDGELLWIEASRVDPEATLEADMEHGLFVPATPLRPELFVMLPGTGGRPRNNSYLLRTAARAGYRTIGLAYPTALSGADVCEGNPDVDCQEKFRREKLYAEDGLDGLDIQEHDAIVPRLVRLLKRLHQQQPDAGFDAYLQDDAPVWDRIVIAGFSQGSGHASYLAMEHLVARLVLFSSGADNIVRDRQTMDFDQAPWVLKPRATPPARHFGILHADDIFEVKFLAYQTFDMDRYGDLVNPEDAAPPYNYTHMLLTDATPANDPSRAHNSLATDAFMPLGEDGLPLMKEAHYYMFTGPIPID